MAKVTTRSLYDQVSREVDRKLGLVSSSSQPNNSSGSLSYYLANGSSGGSSISIAEIINTMQLMLEETLGSCIISGLEVKATDPESSRVTVSPGTGSVGAYLYTLEEEVTVNVPLTLNAKVFYVLLYKNGINVETFVDNKKVLLAKIVVPTDVRATRVIDKDNGGSDAFISMYKEIKFYGSNDSMEEESIQILRNAIGEVLADNLIGNIRLSENLKILNTQGTLELDSRAVKIFDINENMLARFDKDGTHYFNSVGTKIAKFGVTEAYIGNILITANSVETRNFASGALGAGFQIKDNGDAEFNNVITRGKITASVFEYESISSIGGNILLSKGADRLAEDMSALDSSTITIDGDVTLTVGDILRLKNSTNDEWCVVTSTTNAPTYSITRDSSGSYASNNNPEWQAGTAVTNYGQSGDGGIFLTASESNAPYLSVFSHEGSPWSALTTELRVGNLNGFLGYSSDKYGIAIGTDGSYLKYDSVNGLQIKGDITVTAGNISVTFVQDIEPGSSGDTSIPKEGDLWYNPSTTTTYIYEEISGGYVWQDITSSGTSVVDSNGKITLSATPSGAGLYLGSTYMGYYDGGSWDSYIKSDGTFFFGGDGTNYIQWDGSNLVVRGSLIADDISSGTLTGVTISGNTISGNTIQTAAASSRIVMNADGFIAYDDASAIGEEIFKIVLSGTDSGDVVIGDSASTDYVKYDASTGTLEIRGTLSASDITAGTFTGLTIQTASSGARIVMDSDGMVAYDNASATIFQIETTGTNVGDVTFGSGTTYLKWDKSAGTLLASDIQSPDYVSGVSGFKLSSSGGLEVNTGAIDGGVVYTSIDAIDTADIRDYEDIAMNVDLSQGYSGGSQYIETAGWCYGRVMSSTPTWADQGSMESNYAPSGDLQRILGAWFTYAGQNNLSCFFRGSFDDDVNIRLAIVGQNLRGSSVAFDGDIAGASDEATMEIDISSLTIGAQYFCALTFDTYPSDCYIWQISMRYTI